MKLHVGVPELRGKLERFPFSFAEIQAGRSIPRRRVLRTIQEARSDLVLSLRVAPDLALTLTSDVLEKLTLAAERAAFVVLPTTHRTGPTKENLRRLTELAQRLRSETTRVAWEPHGIFEPEEEERWAEEADVLLVRDLTRATPPEGSIVYTRLRSLGTSARPSLHRIDLLAEALTAYEEAYVIVEGSGALRFKKELTGALGSQEAAFEWPDEEDEGEELDLESFAQDEDDGEEEENA
ncbi:MAG: hypothetical protein B6A08_17385 [Sorangiineae bacterium NIC37A_2]|jgi:hypothetical protein|nr:MAG: hypothetical protein B6A08_17385 [Sorangiineae bacterium NIC37A_2]